MNWLTPASCCVDITFILWQTVFSKYGCNNLSQPMCSCGNSLLPNQDGKLILCPLSLCRLCSHLLPSGCLSPSEVMLQNLGCEKRWIQLPPCPLGHSQMKSSAAKKQSNCPGAAKTLQSPKEPMQKDHREKLWDYTREKDVQPSSTCFSFLLLQLESSECMRDLEPELPRQACLNSYPTETADRKMISIVLSHVVWGVICY